MKQNLNSSAPAMPAKRNTLRKLTLGGLVLAGSAGSALATTPTGDAATDAFFALGTAIVTAGLAVAFTVAAAKVAIRWFKRGTSGNG